MSDNAQINQLQKQLAALQAQVDALQQDKQALKEDMVEMQTRIDHLLAELKLSKSQKYGKKSEKAPRGTFNEAEQVKSEPKHYKKGKPTLPEALPNTSSENLLKQGHDIFGYASKNYERFQGPFKDEFIAGGFILKLSPFLFLITFNIFKLKKNNLSKVLIFLSTILIIFSIFITGDRAPFFTLILISLFILFFFNKKLILIFLSSLILILYIAGLNSDKKQRYFDQSLTAFGIENNEFTLDTGYGHLFYSAITIWIDKPLIGAGTKNYRKICDRDKYNFETKRNIQLCSTHPHNYVLELLSETGLIGLIFFYLIFFYLLKDPELIKKILKKNLDNLNIKFSIISLTFILWPISTTGSILTNKSSIILWFIFGIVYSSISIEKKSHSL